MYTENPYVVHATNHIKGCFKRKYGSTLAFDSNLTLVHLCLLKEENPKRVCVKEMHERWMLSVEKEFMVNKEVMTILWIAKSFRENRKKKTKDKGDISNDKDQGFIRK